MKKLNDQFIIGVDHGYGNIKTANHCFKTGMTALNLSSKKRNMRSTVCIKVCKAGYATKSAWKNTL